MNKDHKPHTHNVPERFEEHWQEYNNAGWWLLPALIGGAIVWVIIAWVVIAKYW